LSQYAPSELEIGDIFSEIAVALRLPVSVVRPRPKGCQRQDDSLLLLPTNEFWGGDSLFWYRPTQTRVEFPELQTFRKYA
jgi:hypothetical protein